MSITQKKLLVQEFVLDALCVVLRFFISLEKVLVRAADCADQRISHAVISN